MLSPVKVFYSYRRTDQGALEELRSFLAPLRRAGRIEELYDKALEPGDRWSPELDRMLDDADLVILLITAGYFASEPCWREMERALDRLRRRRAWVVPDGRKLHPVVDSVKTRSRRDQSDLCPQMVTRTFCE